MRLLSKLCVSTRLCRCVCLTVCVCSFVCVFVRMCVFPFLSSFFSLSFLSFFHNKVTCALTTQRIWSVFAPNPCVTKFEPMRETLQKRFSCVTRPPNRLQKKRPYVRRSSACSGASRTSAKFGELRHPLRRTSVPRLLREVGALVAR